MAQSSSSPAPSTSASRAPPMSPSKNGVTTASSATSSNPEPYAHTDAYNPILGYSCQGLAVISRSMHHSQGTGAMRRPGANRSTFTVTGGPPATRDLFDGIDTTWSRLPDGAAVGA